jgi:hypothetical protein
MQFNTYNFRYTLPLTQEKKTQDNESPVNRQHNQSATPLHETNKRPKNIGQKLQNIDPHINYFLSFQIDTT